MTLYQLSPDARRDLTELRLYLTQLPVQPAKKMIREIKAIIRLIAENPYLGQATVTSHASQGKKFAAAFAVPTASTTA